MRIIGGTHRGQRLVPVAGRQTRPTTDKVREALFNMIGPSFRGGHFLDLYAGSGAVALEALSRGVDQAVAIDRQYQAVKTMEKNAANLKITKTKFQIKKMTAARAIEIMAGSETQFDYVFLDPPYAEQQMQIDLDKLAQQGLLKPAALVICETDRATKLPKVVDYSMVRQKNYGLTTITIYQYKD
ncbi:16S rRNA (guanine(966)-N(2))-methyltransferase RsmD [Fructilactobacillus florum]|uniref:Methyltransferase n=1 Tax=Fructilactobacillus florum DSM 22689 = JCM 16035 TaxID=1423745 RepID=A0A0R2CUL3_9LACO|nr:16S rRNA (guanine(966)-N(2))-methyltransferase RsmD [Fructilactobacillus florum]KRM91676.1 hypothetical protein FC87_GL000813 [Fructilactobacillus florum DSM 22689 = JCM 16035]